MIESWPAITEVEVIAASASTARSLSPAFLPSVTVRSPYPISLISYCDAISDAMVVERWASVKLRGVTDLFVIGEKIWHRASTEPGEFNTRPQDEISNAVALDILNPLLRALCAAVEATESVLHGLQWVKKGAAEVWLGWKGEEQRVERVRRSTQSRRPWEGCF